jgi:hypothetical protein
MVKEKLVDFVGREFVFERAKSERERERLVAFARHVRCKVNTRRRRRREITKVKRVIDRLPTAKTPVLGAKSGSAANKLARQSKAKRTNEALPVSQAIEISLNKRRIDGRIANGADV